VHPIAFQLGPLTITWYGVMVMLGFVAGMWTASRRGLLQGVDPERILDLGPWLIIGSVVGARSLYVVTFWHEEFAGKPFTAVFMVWHGGLVYYGGLIGASLGCILYTAIKRIPLWSTADILAPSIALGQALGRIGCLLNGCCYGRACSLPWAIRFPPDNAARAPTFPVHPTEIYESLLDLALYGVLAWRFRRKKFDGQVFAVYLTGYALARSFVELFRGDYPPNQYIGGWLTPGQGVSAVILVAGLLLLALLPRAKGGPEAGPKALPKA
jgi:phosphatidylglycerol:prolipoprotein diacylglycerol transferase